MTAPHPVAPRWLDRTGVRGARRGYALTARKGHGAGLLIAKSARRRGEIALQTGGSGPDSPSTALFATLPATASGHPGNLGLDHCGQQIALQACVQSMTWLPPKGHVATPLCRVDRDPSPWDLQPGPPPLQPQEFRAQSLRRPRRVARTFCGLRCAGWPVFGDPFALV